LISSIDNPVRLTILGSGGATPTPRPFCQCPICEKAKKESEPYKRNSSSLFVDEAFVLIDCAEDIGDSLNRREIKRVDNLLITHWHPDHTFGLRPLLEACFNFLENKADKQIAVYMPKRVLEDLTQHYPSISYLADHLKVADIHRIEHEESVQIGKVQITAIGYESKDSRVFAYLLEQDGKKALYAPCDTLSFKQRIYDLDLLTNECGVFSYDKIKDEISFPALMERIRLLRPKRTVLTHIEEIELNAWGWDYLNRMKKQYSDINFDFAYDGMEIQI
jgi:phosphoribosyl 1,2-cyclic phosphate phosphodiesterase